MKIEPSFYISSSARGKAGLVRGGVPAFSCLNEPKAARLAGFAIHNQFDFRNSAERLKEFPQCTFCHVKGKITDVKLHSDK